MENPTAEEILNVLTPYQKYRVLRDIRLRKRLAHKEKGKDIAKDFNVSHSHLRKLKGKLK